ncbi:MAG: type II toxin-antitoxin system Phd/YefM family antitoxin [Defluviitaleaceae bacterium]|nr:type II toxin-antitoxin system Phd/YefM family antitoxin [Defluviitaleaceae bacterium]
MNIDTSMLAPMTEENFSKVARLVDEEFSSAEAEQVLPDEIVMQISQRLMEKNREAYEVLAK